MLSPKIRKNLIVLVLFVLTLNLLLVARNRHYVASERTDNDVKVQTAVEEGTATTALQSNMSTSTSLQRLVNLVPFEFLAHSNSCDSTLPVAEQPTLIIYVHSGTSAVNREYRQRIRATWATVARKYSVRVDFVVGLPHPRIWPNYSDAQKKAEMDAILAEHALYGDILHPNFLDRYNHLTYKWYSILAYHASHCAHVPFAAYTDDDTIIFVDRLKRFIEEHKPVISGKMMVCNGIFGNDTYDIARQENSPFYVSMEQWPYHKMPAYCSGNFQMVSSEAILSLLEGILRAGVDYIMSFKIWDVPTGIAAAAGGIKFMQFPGRGISMYPPCPEVCDLTYVGQHGMKPIDTLDTLWALRQNCCLDSELGRRPGCIEHSEYPPLPPPTTPPATSTTVTTTSVTATASPTQTSQSTTSQPHTSSVPSSITTTITTISTSSQTPTT